MSRGQLNELQASEIEQNMPEIGALENTVLQLSPDFISMKYKAESPVPVAAVCLQDAVNTIAEARYALFEAWAHKMWYSSETGKDSKFAMVFFSRFYLDNVALRLYSAGEHLAEAIAAMLEISSSDLEPFEKNRVSRQSILGHYLGATHPAHPITMRVLTLAKSRAWQDALNYRNAWVHAQPPLVAGLGIAYERRRRWVVDDATRTAKLGIGGGDEAKYSIDEMVAFIQPALFELVDTTQAIAKHYLSLLEKRGISMGGKGIVLKLGTSKNS